MGWFWADSDRQQKKSTHWENQSDIPSCPIKSRPLEKRCPSGEGLSSMEGCPSGGFSPVVSNQTTKFNMMEQIPQTPAVGQKVALSTQRKTSSIPRGDKEEKWQYPSPQQMYNALLRKGYHDTPVEDVTSMVDVHNFVNEGAWQEVLKWESRHSKEGQEPRLSRFQGRPGEISPKARFIHALGIVYPSKFGGPRPFDRHDWYVQHGERQVRYVIDFYEGPPEVTGEPVFYVDVRPALDSIPAVVDRVKEWVSRHIVV